MSIPTPKPGPTCAVQVIWFSLLLDPGPYSSDPPGFHSANSPNPEAVPLESVALQTFLQTLFQFKSVLASSLAAALVFHHCCPPRYLLSSANVHHCQVLQRPKPLPAQSWAALTACAQKRLWKLKVGYRQIESNELILLMWNTERFKADSLLN